MPVADEATATAMMLAHFKAAWEAQTAPVPPVIYENMPGDPPKDGTPYVKVFVRHAARPQTTLAEVGSRRFTSEGFLLFEVYSRGGVGVTADANYAKVVRDAFMGPIVDANGIWFRNVRSMEQGQRGAMFLVNVLADFEYDTIN